MGEYFLRPVVIDLHTGKVTESCNLPDLFVFDLVLDLAESFFEDRNTAIVTSVRRGDVHDSPKFRFRSKHRNGPRISRGVYYDDLDSL